MSLKCKIGLHSWHGCKCSECGKIQDEQHDWSHDCEICSRCEKARENQHDWSEDCEKCSKCGKTRENKHSWNGCICAKCSIIRNEQHDWSQDCEKCSKCLKTREGEHKWNTCVCEICGIKRADKHIMNNCICTICGEVQHSWNACICTECGKTRLIGEDEMILLIKQDYLKAGSTLWVSSTVRGIGQALYNEGGYRLMLRIANKAVENGVRSLWMNEAWHKIGTWLS
jgi:hypothetical protein